MTKKSVWNLSVQILHGETGRHVRNSHELLVAVDLEDAIAQLKAHYESLGTPIKILAVTHRGVLTVDSYLQH